MNKTFKKFKTHAGFIFTSLIIVVLFSYLFVGIGLNFNLDNTFWTSFIVGFALMIAITTIWYPIAKQKEEQENKQYQKQHIEYSLLMKRVTDTNNLKGLKKFCEYATEENRIEMLKQKLAKENIDYDIYLKYITPNEQGELLGLEEIANEKLLDEKQKLALKHIIIKGLTRGFFIWKDCGYEKINHKMITVGNDDVKVAYTVKNDEKKFDKKMWSAKVITSIICALGMAIIAFTGKGFDLGKLAQMLTWLVMIAWNLINAINNGKTSISVHRTNYFKKLRTYLEEFCESEYYDNTIAWERPKLKEDNNEDKEV